MVLSTLRPGIRALGRGWTHYPQPEQAAAPNLSNYGLVRHLKELGRMLAVETLEMMRDRPEIWLPPTCDS